MSDDRKLLWWTLAVGLYNLFVLIGDVLTP